MLCIIIHFWIVFGYGYHDFNQNRIRIGYHFSKTELDRIAKKHYPIISDMKWLAVMESRDLVTEL